MADRRRPTDEEFAVHRASGGAGARATGVGAVPVLRALLVLAVVGVVVWVLVALISESQGTEEVAEGQQELHQQMREAVEAADEASAR